jgi:flagellar protein FliL
VDNDKVMEELKTKDAIIKDTLITLLTQKTLDYISDVLNMESIRNEIQQAINDKLQKGKVAKVYFTSYILQ